MSYPTTPAPRVETKVKAATFAAYFGLVALLAVLNAVADTNLVSALPDYLEVFVAPMVPAALTLVAGWLAKHTPRPDLPSADR